MSLDKLIVETIHFSKYGHVWTTSRPSQVLNNNLQTGMYCASPWSSGTEGGIVCGHPCCPGVKERSGRYYVYNQGSHWGDPSLLDC